MELLKSNPIIDHKYKPTLSMGYIDYFNRAMVFAQTNYQDHLSKVAKINFIKLSPTIFFEEYVWSVICLHENYKEVSRKFPELSKKLTPFFHSFWNLNSAPNADTFRESVTSIIDNPLKVDAIINCSNILNRGIKLFGWDYYKNNFLNTPEKLTVLPYIGLAGAQHLSRNIGNTTEIISSFRLYHLAARWKFENVKALCLAIHEYFPMPLKIIELILWYAFATFEDNNAT